MTSTRRQFCRSLAQVWAHSAMVSGGFSSGCSTDEGIKEPDRLERLAFGSCNKQDQVQSHWSRIADRNPDAWVWMGDAVYADESSPLERALIYRSLEQNPFYKQFIKQHLIFGTWDDHDYASNDAGASYPLKEASKKAYLDFLGEPLESERRQRPGIYTSRLIGQSTAAVQLILLDMRFFKPKADRGADPLGKLQWEWLEAEIRRPGPHIKILVTSIQLLTDFTGRETWACFPEAQSRLVQLLAQSPVPTVVLSGDRHLAEVSYRSLSDGRSLYELTASGLTHKSELTNANPFRLGEQVVATNFGLLSFDWDSKERGLLRGLGFQAFSPQSGELLLEQAISWSP